ncbi:MAG: ABC transporter permease [Planctomycetes bacterium]|nr:ABC transporter permease [Planctomycetota bacterium]
MKNLAILKDSFREAVDTKVFYFMLGLSCLAILFIGSLSFKPITVQGEVEDKIGLLNRFVPGEGGPRWAISDFQQTNDATKPWEGDYHFVFRVHLREHESAESAQNVQSVLQMYFPWLRGHMQVAETKSSDPRELLYTVTTHGTTVHALRDWPHKPALFFGALPMSIWTGPLGNQLHFVEDYLVGWLGAGIAMLVSTIITAFFIPNMLRKGTVDLLLVKPIHRTTLLIYKFLGGLLFMFLNTVFIVVGIWLVLGLRSGLWAPGFLVTIFILTFEFAIFYAVSTLFGVLTRSPIVAILVTCFAWAVLFGVGYGYRFIDATRQIPSLEPEAASAGPESPEEKSAQVQRSEPRREKLFPNWVYVTADVVHFVLPRLKDLDALMTKLIVRDLLPPDSPERQEVDKYYASIKWGENLTVSGVFIGLLVGLACLRFATTDY